MSLFYQSCIELYKEWTNYTVKLKKVNTPFITAPEESQSLTPANIPGYHTCPWCHHEYTDELPLGERSKPDTATGGQLQPIASRVLMKLLYPARLARADRLNAIHILAIAVTRWTHWCDKALHRLMEYAHSTKDYKTISWIGDDPKEL